MTRIHPSALIDPAAQLAPDVRVGPFAIVEGEVILGPGCIVHGHAHLIGPFTAGANNTFHSGCVIGDAPQHLGFSGVDAHLTIGIGNIFREHVTVHRGSAPGTETVVGDGNFFMAGSHVAHDCHVGNKCIFANAAVIGGHVTVEDGVFLSGNSAIHQHMRVGRLAMVSGVSACTKDLPPFLTLRDFNKVVGVNVVGMRRAGIPAADINGVRQAFRILFMRGLMLSAAVAQVERELGHLACVRELVAFVRSAKRGIATSRGFSDERSEAA